MRHCTGIRGAPPPTRQDPFEPSRLAVSVGMAYGSNVDQVLEILRQCAGEHPRVIKIPPPKVLFMKFGESSLDFELRVYADVENRLDARSELLQAIDRRFREAGVEIPFPKRDLYIRSFNPQP
jgi:potassium-dependent mechanosensitive channel